MLFVGAGQAPAQEEAPEMTPEMQAEMAVWMKLAQPGEHHQHLAPFAGKWKGTVEMWMAPGAEPMTNEARAEVSWIMGDRFLVWKQTGDFGGMPWEGMTIEGYNNGDQRYEASWIDNFGTLILPFTGSCSEGGKVREMRSEFVDHASGGNTIKYKGVYTWVDDDHFIYETFMDKGEGEFRNVKVTYARQ
jgi:hypothetical protein